VKFTLKLKMALLAGVALCGVVALTALSYVQTNKVFDAANYANVNTVPSLKVLGELRRHFLRERMALDAFVVNIGDARLASEEESQVAAEHDKVLEEIKAYEPLISDDKDRAYLKDFGEGFSTAQAGIHEIVAESKSHHDAHGRELLLALNADFEKLGVVLAQHVDYNISLGDKGSQEAQAERKLALVMGKFTAEDAAKSIQNSRRIPELVSVQVGA